MSSSSSSLELQFEITESSTSFSFSLAKCNSPMSKEMPCSKGPDLVAGVLCRGGDKLLNGVGHLEVVELPSGVISVPMSLLLTLSTTASSTMEVSLNMKLSLSGSEHSYFRKLDCCTSFVNLSAIKTTSVFNSFRNKAQKKKKYALLKALNYC